MNNNNNNNKILIALWGFTPTYSLPAPSRALYMFNELKKHFPDTYVIMPKFEGETFELENLIQINPLVPLKGKFRLLKGIMFRFQIAISTLRFAISKNVNFVILRGYDTILVYPFLKLLSINIFYDFHGLHHRELDQQNKFSRAFFVRFIENIILKLSNRIIVVSDGIKLQIQEYQNKCLSLPNGVNIDKIKNANYKCSIELPANQKIIVFIGNWESFMRVDDVCESMKYLRNCTGVIVGKGFNAEYIMKKYHAENNIIFAGRLPQEDTYTILNMSNICILPYDKNDYHSQYHDFFSSRKTKEYIAAGKPVIVADVVGKEGWLVENKNCLLYESGNPKDLADKITILLNDEKLYKTMSENNKRLAEQFTWGDLIKQSGLIEEIYENNAA